MKRPAEPDASAAAKRPAPATQAPDPSGPAAAAAAASGPEAFAVLAPRDHALLRGAMYLGGMAPRPQPAWVLGADGTAAVLRPDAPLCPALLKAFGEIVENALDEVTKGRGVDAIRVVVGDDGLITVTNTGPGMSSEVHEASGLRVPTLCFGRLNAGSNFSDAGRVSGGLNGLGASLVNVFSTRFDVETVDAAREVVFRQTWTENMGRAGEPRIAPAPASARTKDGTCRGHVTVRWMPDYARFGLPGGLDADHRAAFERRTLEAAACAEGVAVSFNGRRVAAKDWDSFVGLHVGGGKRDRPRATEASADGRWRATVALSDAGFRAIAFVNGVPCHRGPHVDAVASAVAARVAAAVKGAAKDWHKTLPRLVRDSMWLFLRCTIENPSFGSQAKDALETRPSAFGSTFAPSDAFIDAIAKKVGVLDEACRRGQEAAARKDEKALAKTDGKARSRHVDIEKLVDAELAGTARSVECRLFVTEGDSARTFVMSTFSVLKGGRQLNGAFPLRGKLPNARTASSAVLANNAEIVSLKTALGLREGVVYASLRQLRYGSLCILTDADEDGVHIRGLVLNWLHRGWPSLLPLGFVCTVATPVVKATRGAVVETFFDIGAYEAWASAAPRVGYATKHYKGLGTNTAAEARDLFKDVDRLRTTFVPDDAEPALALAFGPDADARKALLAGAAGHDAAAARRAARKGLEPRLAVGTFVRRDLTEYMLASVARGIPHLLDGLKTSQRKCLYTCFAEKQTAQIKVEQLAAVVSVATAYHHAGASLETALVNLAQDFMGSNNVPLLRAEGQFGSRVQNGADHASPRYIFTALAPVARRLFDPRDDPALARLACEGRLVEPEFYAPVLPVVLLNGVAAGIASGWSCFVPPFRPADVLANVRRFLAGETLVPMDAWYRGFRGSVARVPGGFALEGLWARDGASVRITEAPPGVATDAIVARLVALRKAGRVAEFVDASDDTRVNIAITLPADDAPLDPAKDLGLAVRVSTKNMTLHDRAGRVRRFETPEEVLREYAEARLDLYGTRRTLEIARLEAEAARVEERARFVAAFLEDHAIVTARRPRAEILAGLRARGFGAAEDHLAVPIGGLTQEKIDALVASLAATRADLERVRAATPARLWGEDLDAIAELVQ